MPKRAYKMRINVKQLTEDRLYSFVAMSDECVAMFDKPYVSVKRMQDRLAFVPWDNKTGRGTVLINNNTMQFGVQSDCEKMQDFCGEYNIVNKTDNGIVFVKLEDRKPFVREMEDPKRVPHDKVADLPAGTTVTIDPPPVMYETGNVPTLKELLGKEIEDKQAELAKINAEIERLKKEYIEPMIEKAEAIDRELYAFCNAYNCLKDGE